MKNKYCLFCLIILSVILLNLGFSASAFAATVDVKIPVEVVIKGEGVESITTTITIKAIDSSSPMPADSSITIKDSGTKEIGPISYTKPGDYTYLVSQSAEVKENFTYDTTEYVVTVRIVNDGNGGLKSIIFAHLKNNPDIKPDKLVFTHTYQAKPAIVIDVPSKPKTGDRNQLVIWSTMLIVSALYLGYVLYKGLKRD